MALQKLELQPWLIPYADYAIAWHQKVTGTRPTITSSYRSFDKQIKLYEARHTNPYPVNRPGDSAHNWGLAFDSDVPDVQMPTWIWIRRQLGFRVPDNDEVHAEVPDWRGLVDAAFPGQREALMARYRA